MHTLCNVLNKEGFLGVSKEDLIPKASDREEAWKASNGIVVRGAGSRLSVHRTEFLSCIQGCIIKKGSSAELVECTFRKCGRDRADAAALAVMGQGSTALCRSCVIEGCDHHGVKAEAQGHAQLVDTKILHANQQGVLSVGRDTRVDLDGCLLQDAGLCGLRANQNGCIHVMNTEILRCHDAGIFASFLGTKIEVKGGVTLEGNGGKHPSSRGIVAENEGCVYVSGKNHFKDELIAHGHARIEEPNRRHAVEAAEAVQALALTAGEGALAAEATIKRRSKKHLDKKPQTRLVMDELSKVFDNAAEAFVMIDINAGGGISLLELDRALKKMDIKGVDIKTLAKELHLQSGVELDADAFIHNFMWHTLDTFPDSSWQMAFVEASRQRKRIVKRFYERAGIEHEDDAVLGSNWRGDFVAQEMEKRMQSQRNFQKKLIANIKKGDHRAERKKGIQYIEGGHIFRSKSHHASGEAYSKFACKHGLPGTRSIHRDTQGRLSASVEARVDCWPMTPLGPAKLVAGARSGLAAKRAETAGGDLSKSLSPSASPVLGDVSSDMGSSGPGSRAGDEGADKPSTGGSFFNVQKASERKAHRDRTRPPALL